MSRRDDTDKHPTQDKLAYGWGAWPPPGRRVETLFDELTKGIFA